MKRKVLATLLSVTMVAGLLAGCGSSEEATTTTEDTTETEEAPVEETEAADEEAATDNSAAIDGLIAATDGPVALTVWASEEDQDLTAKLVESFKALYPDVTFEITIGACSESDTKDNVLVDIEAAADVFAFADDQINDLVAAGALQPVSATYTYDVSTANVESSVEAASVNGTLYAYPMTADNGYFMFYDKSVFTEEDVQSLDKMMEVAEAAGKKVSMDVANGWYLYSFFAGAGLNVALAEDGINNVCDWNAAGGTDVAQAILDICANPGFLSCTDEEFATAIADGTIVAGVNGTWRAADAEAAWGENYAACKLPTFTVAGEQVQMSSYSGFKLIGVNPHSSNIGWSMLLAEYLTSEEAQVERFGLRGLGPANINAAASDEVQTSPAIAALGAQAEYATPQRVGGSFWTPAETLGKIFVGGNTEGTDLQTLLDNAVDGIVQPVAE